MNTSSRYLTTIHILTLLAEKDMPLSSALIAQSVGANPVTIRKAIGKLRDCGYVETIAGSAGGTRLAKHPTKITLKELYVLLNEDGPFGIYPPDGDPRCVVGPNLQPVLDEIHQQAHQQLVDALDETTIADVLEQVLEKHSS